MENLSTYANYIKGVEVDFADSFVQNYDQYQSELMRLGVYKNFNDKEARKIFTNRPGTGFLQANHQGGEVNEKNRYPGYQTEAIPTIFDGGITVTAQTLQLRKIQLDLDEYGDLVRSGNATKDLLLSQPWIHAFDTDQPTSANGIKITRYGDLVPMCSTVHPTRVPGQSSQSNASATGAALTYTEFDTARQALVQQKTDDGISMGLSPKIVLMVGPALLLKAKELSGSELKIDSADNNINVYGGGVVTVIENLYLSSDYGCDNDDYWFMIDVNRAKLFFWEMEQLVPNNFEHRNRSMSFDVFASWSGGHYDWRGIFGSMGGGAAYAS